MSSSEHSQILRNAWINAVRAEVLRVASTIPEVARVGGIGVWIATYADADGTNAFPSRETLAALAGCSQETVTRAVQVLMDVGLLGRKRRPNASSVYQLLLPTGRPDWAKPMRRFTDTRQRRAHAAEKAKKLNIPRTASTDANRKASTVAVRTASAAGVPNTPETARTASMDAPGQRPWTPSGQRPQRGSTSNPRISDTDQLQDHEVAGVVGHGADPAREAPNAPIDEAGFALTDGMRRWAHRDGYADLIDIDHATAQFVSHYRATGTTRRSWPDAWQKWIRDDAQRAATRRPNNVYALPNGQHLTGTDAKVAGWHALAAELSSQEDPA